MLIPTRVKIHKITTIADDLLQEIYDSGNWAIISFFTISTLLQFNGCFINYGVAFTGADIPFYCISGNYTSKANTCYVFNGETNKTILCTSSTVKFSKNEQFMYTSIISDYKLVCDQNYKNEIIQTVLICGLFVGGIMGPPIGDRYGRKPIFLTSVFVSGFVGVIVGLLPYTQYVLLCVCKFIMGCCRELSMTNGYVLILEYIPSKKQNTFGMLNQVIWALTMSSFSIFAYLLRYWYQLQIACSIPALLSLFFHFLISESPRWLITNGEITRVEDMINTYVKRFNNKDVSYFNDSLTRLRSSHAQLISPIVPYKPWDILKSKWMMLWTSITALGWIYCGLGVFSLTTLVTRFPGNPFIVYAVSSLLDILGILFGYVLAFYSRNLTVFLLQFISCICFINAGILLTIDVNRYISTSLLVIGKMCLLSTIFIISLSSLYVYPSSLRIVGSSIPTTIGKLFAISTPYFIDLFSLYKWMPTLILGILSILVGFYNLLYPEWLNKPIPETISEAEDLKHYMGCRYSWSELTKSPNKIETQG